MKEVFTDYKCMQCLLKKYGNPDSYDLTNRQKTDYFKDFLHLLSAAPPTMSSPELVEKITALQHSYGIIPADYTKIKQTYNALLLSIEKTLYRRIEAAENPLHRAVQFAFLGNYIDFGAVSDISETKVLELVENADNFSFNEAEFSYFQKELNHTKTLIFLTDNCGEIVMDKLLLCQLSKQYPHLSIEVVVRGRDVLNDATIEDARQIGLDSLFPVISNGCGIAGTVLSRIDEAVRKKIESADMVIAKGMGNFETLKGCGKNIYYWFMCKCEKFCRMLELPLYHLAFLNEKRMNK